MKRTEMRPFLPIVGKHLGKYKITALPIQLLQLELLVVVSSGHRC